MSADPGRKLLFDLAAAHDRWDVKSHSIRLTADELLAIGRIAAVHWARDHRVTFLVDGKPVARRFIHARSITSADAEAALKGWGAKDRDWTFLFSSMGLRGVRGPIVVEYLDGPDAEAVRWHEKYINSMAAT